MQPSTRGAHLINDVSAGDDPKMMEVVGSNDVGYAAMHMQGTPQTMQANPQYDEVVSVVRDALEQAVDDLTNYGVGFERILIDPGFGFGKTLEHNLSLLKHLSALRISDLPLLVGLSRKSLLGLITDRPVEARMPASVAAAVLAVQNGADMIRCHDVAATVDGLKVLGALQHAG